LGAPAARRTTRGPTAAPRMGMKHSLKVLRRQQTYNAFVANEAIEDYSLRYAASSFRRWPEWLLANTALGGTSFLALEAIGALLVIDYGFTNSTLAILTVAAVILLTGLPIAYYTSRYNVDIDLLTRGAGFGYLGSTITSLIYASYTIIFFAIEAAIMAKALQMGLGMPVSIGYLLSSIIIIPLVFYGITVINGLQLYTQPIWIVLSILPFLYILGKTPNAIGIWAHFAGMGHRTNAFDPLLYGSAMSVGFSLIAQIGEQVDYLRFLPDKKPENRLRWWLALVSAGPGWIVPGGVKLLCGSFLAVYCISRIGYSRPEVTDPVRLYLLGFGQVFADPRMALAVTVLFVIVCQVKINVTNAYAGSLAWSNFFSRISHSHPGRAIWILLNIVLAILIMQFGLLYILNSILLVYAMFAMAWIGAIFADLAILKPLGVSPAHIEFKRANLYNINPVGFGAMTLGFAAALLGHFGLLGVYIKAFAAPAALVVSIAAALVIAALTKGRYYLARQTEALDAGLNITCTSCNKDYEAADIVLCPAYGEYVCSLCCSLDSVCKGICKRPRANSLPVQEEATPQVSPHLWRRLKIFGVYFGSAAGVLTVVFALIYAYFAMTLHDDVRGGVFLTLFAFVLVITGMWTWWFSLIQEYRLHAEDELDKYIQELENEGKRRQAISAALQETEQLQRLILENATIGIAYVKNDYIIWKNKRFAIYSGLNEDARDCCLHASSILKDEALYDKLIQDAQAHPGNGKKFTLELPGQKDMDHCRWSILSINAVNPDCLRDGSIWLLNDITEHKLAEENLRMSEDRLRELNESLETQVRNRTEELKKSYESIRQADKMASLGILVSGMAHEINNPISFIMLNSGIIQDVWHDVVRLMDEHYGTSPDLWIGRMPYASARTGIEKLLKGIHQGAVRVSGIVRNLKEYAKQTPLDMTGDVDLNKALGTSLELLANGLRKATNDLRVDKGTDLPLFKGDVLRIEQVLINLIQNAYQSLRTRCAAIHIRTYREEDSVVFEINDQGRGISQEDLDHVLDPFFTTKRDCGGTGLGLSVSAGIVKEHGGTLAIESVPGEGTRVVLTFPAAAN
jgi:signal transduction histidine kinase/purine-cytosine permease-like protein